MMNADTARKFLEYDPKIGIFKWRVAKGRVLPGSIAGAIGGTGHRSISIDGKRYLAHRIAWLLQYGSWPPDQIDHINGIRDDNRIENLRAVSNAENGRNQARYSTNKSGVTGVNWDESRRKWAASIRFDGKSMNLGRYDNLLEAACSRKSAEIRFGFHVNHGRN